MLDRRQGGRSGLSCCASSSLVWIGAQLCCQGRFTLVDSCRLVGQWFLGHLFDNGSNVYDLLQWQLRQMNSFAFLFFSLW
jgi:hypothetical protein